jgi:hypothetical protein
VRVKPEPRRVRRVCQQARDALPWSLSSASRVQLGLGANPVLSTPLSPLPRLVRRTHSEMAVGWHQVATGTPRTTAGAVSEDGHRRARPHEDTSPSSLGSHAQAPAAMASRWCDPQVPSAGKPCALGTVAPRWHMR